MEEVLDLDLNTLRLFASGSSSTSMLKKQLFHLKAFKFHLA